MSGEKDYLKPGTLVLAENVHLDENGKWMAFLLFGPFDDKSLASLTAKNMKIAVKQSLEEDGLTLLDNFQSKGNA